MNKLRRERLDEIAGTLTQAMNDLDEVRDEEEEYWENMPESLSTGEKGAAAEEAVMGLSDASALIEEAVEYIENAKE